MKHNTTFTLEIAQGNFGYHFSTESAFKGRYDGRGCYRFEAADGVRIEMDLFLILEAFETAAEDLGFEDYEKISGELEELMMARERRREPKAS